eukprot:5146064-Alexandrium_andersonii.AAC.1
MCIRDRSQVLRPQLSPPPDRKTPPRPLSASWSGLQGALRSCGELWGEIWIDLERCMERKGALESTGKLDRSSKRHVEMWRSEE